MRKVLLTLLILAEVSPCLAKYSGGSGEPNDPYLISTAEDMNQIGRNSSDWGKCFKLTADIDMSVYTGGQYKIIGGNSNPSFTGTFDGDGHIIRNLNYAWPYSNYVGLFGYTSNATIKNVHLEDVNISAYADYTGGLVGRQVNGSIINCSSTGSINTAPAHEGSFAETGGLVGSITDGNIKDCFSSGSVSAISSLFETMSQAGGLVGYQYNGTITNSYSTDSVTITSSSPEYFSYTGGLVGCSFGNINNCYSAGSVTNYSPAVYAGGLMGYQGNISSAKIDKCYSIGQVSATGTYVHKGGLIGRANGTVTSCLWDINTSGQSVGIGSGTATGGTGETTAQMKTLSTFTSAGWDFVWETANGTNDIWAICEGNSYPKLAWQFTAGDSDSDKDVDFTDFAILSNKWRQADSNLYCGGADLTGDAIVDIADLAAFADNWLQ